MKEITIKKNFYDGNNQCTIENINFFSDKLRTLVESNTKMTFRQWLNKVIALLDIIN